MSGNTYFQAKANIMQRVLIVYTEFRIKFWQYYYK